MPGTSEGKPRILIVDDEPDNLQVLDALLTLKGGFRVDKAGDGAQAFARIDEALPDLILLDVMMPGIDGCEVCRRLKAAPATRDTPVILLTARGDLQSKVKGLEAGAEDYITKPFHPDEVLARVRSLLTIGDLRRKLVHAERLAAIAQMAVTVKHEVNNPLSVIQGNAELLEATLADAPPAVHAKLRGIVEQVGRIQQALSRLDSPRRADTATYQGGTLMISLDDGGEEQDA